MNEGWDSVRLTAKRVLAAVVFVLLLIGGGATVLSALAAGMTALSNIGVSGPRQGTVQPVSTAAGSGATGGAGPTGQTGAGGVSSTGGNGGAGGGGEVGAALGSTGSGNGTAGAIGSNQTATGSNPPAVVPGNSDAQTAVNSSSGPSSGGAADADASDRFYSPVGEAIDQGGVILGNQVQDGFGHFLANMLHVLFLEQSAPADATAPVGAGASGAGTGDSGRG
jgi:hypothetical protein